MFNEYYSVPCIRRQSTGHQWGAGDPPAVREQDQLYWVDLCVMSSRLMLRLTGLPKGWIYSQPGHAERCVLSLFRTSEEKQMWTPCCIPARQQHLQEGISSKLVQEHPGQKTLWGKPESLKTCAFLFSTESVRTMTCRCLLTSSAGFGHKKLAQTWKQQQIHSEGNRDVFSQDSTTTYIIFSMSRELNWS